MELLGIYELVELLEILGHQQSGHGSSRLHGELVRLFLVLCDFATQMQNNLVWFYCLKMKQHIEMVMTMKMELCEAADHQELRC